MKRLIKKMIALALAGPLFHVLPSWRIKVFSEDEALQVLRKHAPDQKQSTICDHAWTKPAYDLTIIVPVYNAEKYLDECLNSILHQKTDYRFHVVVIDDGSKDNSPRILEQYGDDPRVDIIYQENGGAAKARNSGLKEVRGRYIMFVDADDFLPENAVEVLMGAAYRMESDIVQGSYLYADEKSNISALGIRCEMCTHVAPNGTLQGFVCGKVYQAELFKEVQFPEGYWYEDTIITAIITHLAKNIVTIPMVGYYYRHNADSMTNFSRGKPKSIDTYWVHRSILQDRRELGMVTDRAFYEHLLRMVALSYRRTEKEPDEVKMALLVLWRELLLQERKASFVLQSVYARLEEAVLACDFTRYAVLCKFCI